MKFSLLRFTNLLLLFILAVLGLTGAYSLFWTWTAWMMDVHRLAGILLAALIPWKVAISWGSLKRGLRWNWDRGVVVVVSLLLAVLTIGVIVFGFGWYWQLGPTEAWLRQTVISWHWMIGLGLGVPLIFHIWQRWPRPRRVDFVSRRAFLRMAGLSAAGLVGWRLADALAAQRSQVVSPRRFTGSHSSLSYAGNQYPITNNPGEGINPASLDTWQLTTDGEGQSRRVWQYADLLKIPAHSTTATIDCTLGWYSAHRWQGIALPDLLDLDQIADIHGYGVLLESTSGYAHVIPFPEANAILLATHVDDEVLDDSHGYPLRAVVPSRRGWFWVKWLTRVSVVKIAA